MKAELKLKCLNTDLLWAKGYHNLEIRNVKRIPANTNFLELQNYGSLIEQETVVDSNIITNPNRQEKFDFLLEHFPVMSASRSGILILINIHDFPLNKDDFMSLCTQKKMKQMKHLLKRFIRKKNLVDQKNMVENLYRKNSWD